MGDVAPKKRLVPLRPTIAPSMWPEPFRWLVFSVFAWCSVSFSCSLYYLVPMMLTVAPIALWFGIAPTLVRIALGVCVISYVCPLKQWKTARTFWQIWYEIFDVRVSLNDMPPRDTSTRYIFCQFPHGVIPFTATMFSSLTDQHCPELYPRGAISPTIKYMPLFRNLYGWLNGGSPDKEVLRKEMETQNIFCMPEGIAGIFASAPSSHKLVFKNRKGLVKLAIEHGATLVPIYTFGISECFTTLTGDSFDGPIGRFSRSSGIAFCVFWGQYFLPIPRAAKISFVYGKGVKAPKLPQGQKEPSNDVVDRVHAEFCKSLKTAFDLHKEEAGYADAELTFV
eukprot:m.156137 g.156137  ORF g.156137 m.156137 type:complete len:338 (-) comp30976_c0_seq3:107-1120(-)